MEVEIPIENASAAAVTTETITQSSSATNISVKKKQKHDYVRFQDFSDWSVVFNYHLKTGFRSDFSFIVGNMAKPFPAHRFILELRSDVLCRIMDESLDNTFHLPNATPHVFKMFLYFIYNDNIPIHRHNMPVDDFIELLKLAVEFNVGRLYRISEDILKKRIALDTVVKIHINAKRMGYIQLETTAFNYMIRHASTFIVSDYFLDLEMPILCDFMKLDELECYEFDLYNAVMRWGKHQTRPSYGMGSVREAIKNVIHFIRFPLMTSKEIAEHVAPNQLFGMDEMIALYTYVCSGSDSKPKMSYFSCTPRSASLRQHNDMENMETIKVVEQPTKGLLTVDMSCQTMPASQYSEDGTQTDSPIIEVPIQTNLPEQFLSTPPSSDVADGTVKNANENAQHIQQNEFVLPVVGDCEINTDDKLNAKKRRRIMFSSPPSSVISSICNSNITRCNTQTKTRRERGIEYDGEYDAEAEEQVDSDASDDLFTLTFKSESENLEVDTWESYIRRWQKSKKSLNHLELRNCKIQNCYPNIVWPYMRHFVLDLVIPLNSSSEPSEIQHFYDVFDLRKYIFFTKENGPWKFDELWEMNVKLELVINGVKFFKMCRQEKEVTISFGNDSTELLGAMVQIDSKNFEKLNLAKTDIPPPKFSCEALREVVLFEVRDLFKSELGHFLRRCKNLEKLSCVIDRHRWDTTTQYGIQDKSPINLADDLTSKSKLKRVAVSKVKLIFNPCTLEKSKKENLEELFTNLVHWSPAIYEKFHLLFPCLKRVSFKKCPFELYDNETSGRKNTHEKLLSSVTIRLMTNVLKITTIEWIKVWGMDWDYHRPQDSNAASSPSTSRVLRNTQPVTDEEDHCLRTFLKQAGLKEPLKNFVLEKDSITAEWKATEFVTQENDPQSRYNWDTMGEPEYGYFELDKIYKDFNIFKQYR